jgi:hypothetical protein
MWAISYKHVIQLLVKALPIEKGEYFIIIWPNRPSIQFYKEGPCHGLSYGRKRAEIGSARCSLLANRARLGSPTQRAEGGGSARDSACELHLIYCIALYNDLITYKCEIYKTLSK